MSNERKYHTAATGLGSKKVKPPVRRVRKQGTAYKGCSRYKKRQAEVRASSHVAHAFLKISFLPKLQEREGREAFENTAKVEGDFYNSLPHLAKRYGICPTQTQSYGYPFNIAMAMADVTAQLKSKVWEWQEIRLIHHEGNTFFATEERFDTGRILYYIPVIPLYKMLKNPKYNQAARLLLSVCSYMYRIADLPYYRQECSYLHSMYESLIEWQMDEDEELDPDFIAEFNEAGRIGDIMERLLNNSCHLSSFQSRLDCFKPDDPFDEECLQLAKKVFELYREYPDTPVYNRIRPTGQGEEDGEQYEVSFEKYISFFASANGLVADLLTDMINNDLQELTCIHEPMIYRPIDDRKMEEENFDFEERIFPLIEDLAAILNEYK